MKNTLLILSHGMESGPNASKISRLSEIAEGYGVETLRPDYGTTAPPEQRIAQLRAVIAQHEGKNLLLGGSSMGAYISGMVANSSPVSGLFLLAPPVFFAGRNPALQLSRCARISIVHGWSDELIDAGEVVAIARAYQAELTLLADTHRLSNSQAQINRVFEHWLKSCLTDNAAQSS